MRRKVIPLMVLAMIAVTSVFADTQSDWVDALRKWGPTQDFSLAAWNNKYDNMQYMQLLEILAQADAMLYFQDHTGLKKDDYDFMTLGKSHAFKHRLIGQAAGMYATDFWTTLNTLIEQQ
jgi:hypothetical protein